MSLNPKLPKPTPWPLTTHLKQGQRQLLLALGEVRLHHAVPQRVLPHQPPAAVFAEIEVLEDVLVDVELRGEAQLHGGVGGPIPGGWRGEGGENGRRGERQRNTHAHTHARTHAHSETGREGKGVGHRVLGYVVVNIELMGRVKLHWREGGPFR